MNDETQELEKALGEGPSVIQTDPIPSAPEPAPGMITLRMPRSKPYEEGFEFPEGNLDFGTGSKHSANHALTNIKFTIDGRGDGFAVIREDHPALADLLRRYPQVELVDTNPRPIRYGCPDCDKDYATKKALKVHQKTHAPDPEK